MRHIDNTLQMQCKSWYQTPDLEGGFVDDWLVAGIIAVGDELLVESWSGTFVCLFVCLFCFFLFC